MEIEDIRRVILFSNSDHIAAAAAAVHLYAQLLISTENILFSYLFYRKFVCFGP